MSSQHRLATAAQSMSLLLLCVAGLVGVATSALAQGGAAPSITKLTTMAAKHGGTYNQDNGGAFGVAAVAWLKWHLMGDTSPAGRGWFVGSDCGVCKDSKWKTASRSLR
jgi:hypothetical protein